MHLVARATECFMRERVLTKMKVLGCLVAVPAFGEDPETLSEHSILAVSHG